MKRNQFLYLLTCSLFSATCSAEIFKDYSDSQIDTNYDTYMGVNFKQNWITPRADWRKLFERTAPGFNVYFGWRFHPNFGAELGYEWTNDKPRTISVDNGAVLLGVQNTSGAPIIMTNKVRYKTGALDLNAFIPLIDACCLGDDIIPEGILSVGVAGMKAQMKIRATPANAAAAAFTGQFTPIVGRSKAVYRFGVGVQALVLENFGLRALLRYETTSILRGRNSVITSSGGTRVIFKDAATLAVGLFFKF